MKTLTIFTPTYNRGYILDQCYSSLCNQTNKDFIWLVIDDGSTDDTGIMVRDWQKKGIIEIELISKCNEGMCSCYNVAYDNCKTELIVCLDSDDDLESNAVESIIFTWKNRKRKDVIGIVANEHSRNTGLILGKDFPNEIDYISYKNIVKNRISGDKVYIIRSSETRKYRFPVYEGEKLYPTAEVFLMLPGDYVILREHIMNKEYLEDGYTKLKNKMYYNNPKGFCEGNKNKMALFNMPVRVIKSSIHYVACGLLSNKRHLIRESPRKFITICFYPFGYLWYIYLNHLKNC